MQGQLGYPLDGRVRAGSPDSPLPYAEAETAAARAPYTGSVEGEVYLTYNQHVAPSADS